MTATHFLHLARRLAVTAPLVVGAACASAGESNAGPAVGEAAPSFSVQAVTREGPVAAPVTLQEQRGKTVVLAFFPKARTPGCTTQMEAYRDQFATIFNGGKDVLLLAVSTDSDDTLVRWARESNFPFTFVSDADGVLAGKYGALGLGGMFDKRVLYVIDPGGKVSYKAAPFRQSSADAYTQLDAEIDRVATP